MEKERINQTTASRVIQQKQNYGINGIVDNRHYSSFPFLSNPTAQRVSEEDEETMQGKFDSSVQRMEDEDEEPLQGKFESPVQRASEEDEDTLQGKFDKPIQKKNETGMPDNLKAGIENLSGFSMDDVRVHYNSSKPATVQALAYTQGTDIHIAPGQEKHLPHEAWHVAQQKAGRVSPTTIINGMPVNDNAGLEHEADLMGEKAMIQRKADEKFQKWEGDPKKYEKARSKFYEILGLKDKGHRHHGANYDASIRWTYDKIAENVSTDGLNSDEKTIRLNQAGIVAAQMCAPVQRKGTNVYFPDSKEPHFHIHDNGVTFTDIGHRHTQVVANNAVTTQYQEILEGIIVDVSIEEDRKRRMIAFLNQLPEINLRKTKKIVLLARNN